jgi:hypothetical protein
MVKIPAGRVDILALATPPLRDALPSELLPFVNVTVPVGVGPAELTVAIPVTGWP